MARTSKMRTLENRIENSWLDPRGRDENSFGDSL